MAGARSRITAAVCVVWPSIYGTARREARHYLVLICICSNSIRSAEAVVQPPSRWQKIERAVRVFERVALAAQLDWRSCLQIASRAITAPWYYK